MSVCLYVVLKENEYATVTVLKIKTPTVIVPGFEAHVEYIEIIEKIDFGSLQEAEYKVEEIMENYNYQRTYWKMIEKIISTDQLKEHFPEEHSNN